MAGIFTIQITAVLTLLFVTYYHGVSAIDIKGARESSCFEINKTVPLDLNWMMSQKTWYYPLMSRADLYHAAIDLSGKSAKELREDEVYYDSCITFELVNGKFDVVAFNGKRSAFTVKPIKGIEVFEFSVENGDMGGTCYTTLTDNKTFAVAACCLADGQMTWGIQSTVEKLPEKTVKQVYDHQESLGFKREFFTGLRYDHCKNVGKDSSKNEL